MRPETVRAAAGLVATMLSSAVACNDAKLIHCAPGTYLRDADGAEYCLYAPDEVPRDVLGRPRCPADVPVLTEFPGGFLCTRDALVPGALPDNIADALAEDPGPIAPVTSDCLGERVVVAEGPPASVAELIGTRAGGFAVAWAGAVRELSDDGREVGSNDVPLDRGMGYGLAELSDGLVVAWADETWVVTARPGSPPTGGSYPFPASGPSLGVDSEGRLVLAYTEHSDGLGYEVASARLAPATLDPNELALPRWFVATPLRPAVARGSQFVVAGGASLDWATSLNAGELLHPFPGIVVSVDVDAQLEGTRTAVIAGRTVYFTTLAGHDLELGTIAGDTGRVSLARLPEAAAVVVAFDSDGSGALRRIDDDGPLGLPTLLAAEGLHDVAVASNARSVAVVWAQRAASGNDELVFARYTCTE